MRYLIILTHADGHQSYLTHNDRTRWERRAARRHQSEFVSKLQAGYFPHIAMVALVAV